MTDKTEVKEPTKSETDRLQKLAEAYEKDGTLEPGIGYRLVTRGGESHWVATRIEKQ